MTNVDNSIIGRFATGHGIALVTGTGSTWTTNAYLSIGEYGTGELTVADSGSLISNASYNYIGREDTGDGTVLITGSGSNWTMTGNLRVGAGGEGNLTVSDGGLVSNDNAIIGTLTGPNGTAVVAGSGSTWTNTSYLGLGNFGTGTLTVADGGLVEASIVILGVQASASGTVNFGAASGETAGAVGFIDTPTFQFRAGEGNIVFNHTDETETFEITAALVSTTTGTHNIIHEAGWTKYSGDGSGFAGTTEVDGGTLSMDGSLGGTVNVNDGGRLEGTGVFSGPLNVNSGGTFAPGNSIGTTTVADIVFDTGSVYEVEIDDQGNSDLIDATGTATINGGTVTPLGTPGQGLTYTILTAANGVTGTFDDVTRNLLYEYALSYDANNVFLTAEVLHDNFCDVAATANQAAVACTGLDSLPDTNDIAAAVLALTSDEAGRAAFNLLSGEIHPSLKGALMQNGQRRASAVLERLQRGQGALAGRRG